MLLRFLVGAILFRSKNHELDFVPLCVMKKEVPVVFFFFLEFWHCVFISDFFLSLPIYLKLKRTKPWFLVSILIPVSDVIGLPQSSTESLTQLSQESGEKFKKIPADCSGGWATGFWNEWQLSVFPADIWTIYVYNLPSNLMVYCFLIL